VKPSIPEIQQAVAKLVEFFRDVPDGEDVAWLRVEAETGVTMDEHGKPLVRRALKKLGRPYASVRGVGLRMSSAENALSIVQGGFVRVDNALRRTDKTREVLAARHLDQMTPGDQQKMLVLAGFFGAVRTFARDASLKVSKG
jgi:hypothetical protein